MRRRTVVGLGLGLTALAGFGAGAMLWYRRRRHGPPLPVEVAPADPDAFAAGYETPLAPPGGPLRVFHIGHSLVGRDMPAMLAQIAEGGGFAGHDYASQAGWGTPLRVHWEPSLDIPGLDQAGPWAKPADAALASGDYDALVATEMVEIRDAIKWHASPEYLARWAERARTGNPAIRVYLYETWHPLTDEEGWLERIDADLDRYWIGELMRGAAVRPGGAPIYLIPGGQAMARVARAAEAGEIEGLTRREDLFAKTETGEQDVIHFSDIGAYVVALTHYAVLYQKNPEGVPHALTRVDGTPSEALSALSAETVAGLQRLVWDAVRAAPWTGLDG